MSNFWDNHILFKMKYSSGVVCMGEKEFDEYFKRSSKNKSLYKTLYCWKNPLVIGNKSVAERSHCVKNSETIAVCRRCGQACVKEIKAVDWNINLWLKII
jgi:hypothetical protein